MQKDQIGLTILPFLPIDSKKVKTHIKKKREENMKRAKETALNDIGQDLGILTASQVLLPDELEQEVYFLSR